MPRGPGRGQPWEGLAGCGTADAELFFAPAEYETPTQKNVRETAARAVCARCPVLERCRELVDQIELPTGLQHWFGIWAGETRNERARRRLERARVAL